jgi:CHAD domain-containing protein
MTDRTASALGLALAARMAAQTRVAMDALDQAQDRHRAVHEARKAIRRIRSGLALSRKTLGIHLTPVDNELKRLAKGLSRLRDAHVIVAAAKQLEVRRDRLLASALEKDAGFKKRQDRLEKVAAKIAELPWHGVAKHEVQDAIDRSARQAGRAKASFEATSTPASLHRWRRRVRRLRLQYETIKELESEGSFAHAKHQKPATHSLGKLADSLGRKQDLQVLSASLKEIVDPATARKLRAEIRREMHS